MDRRPAAPRPARARRVALGLLALLGLLGCTQRRDAAADPDPVDMIQGLSTVRYNPDLNTVEVARGKAGNAGCGLLINGFHAEAGKLRTGDAFIITDGALYVREYQVLAASPRAITLKQTIYEDKRAEGEGIHRNSRVLAVAPYDLDRPLDPTLEPGAPPAAAPPTP